MSKITGYAIFRNNCAGVADQMIISVLRYTASLVSLYAEP